MSTSQAFDESSTPNSATRRRGSRAGLWADVIGDVGAFSIYPWTAALEPGRSSASCRGLIVSSTTAAACAASSRRSADRPYRGVGRPISTFVMERLIDMAAARSWASDPKELRLRNLVDAKEFPTSRFRHRLG